MWYNTQMMRQLWLLGLGLMLSVGGVWAQENTGMGPFAEGDEPDWEEAQYEEIAENLGQAGLAGLTVPYDFEIDGPTRQEFKAFAEIELQMNVTNVMLESDSAEFFYSLDFYELEQGESQGVTGGYEVVDRKLLAEKEGSFFVGEFAGVSVVESLSEPAEPGFYDIEVEMWMVDCEGIACRETQVLTVDLFPLCPENAFEVMMDGEYKCYCEALEKAVPHTTGECPLLPPNADATAEQLLKGLRNLTEEQPYVVGQGEQRVDEFGVDGVIPSVTVVPTGVTTERNVLIYDETAGLVTEEGVELGDLNTPVGDREYGEPVAEDEATADEGATTGESVAPGTRKVAISMKRVTPVRNLAWRMQNGRLKLSDIPLVIIELIDLVTRIAGTIAVVMLIYGGYQMMVSGVTEDRDSAKKTVQYALTGLAVTFLAWVIVNFVQTLLTSVPF